MKCLSYLFICALLCGCASKVPAPSAVYPVPEPKQVEWQKMETNAFIHFGLNTFNNREWGYGDSDPSTFHPTRLDCEQWVRTLKAAGMKGVILTAKHHDGFCLWPTKLTEYCVRNSPYKGDVVGELEKACRKYGLKFAVYLSPWDRHQSTYGTPAYLPFFYSQLRELLTRYGKVFEVWFDGANGGDGWYGGAKEVRTIDRKHYYNFPKVYQMLDSIQPQAVVFGDGGPGCRWVGNEQGFAGETNWSFLRKGVVYPGYPNYRELQYGHADGNQWVPAECDVSIRPGWFYHDAENERVKTPAQLTDLYYKSVGRNGLLLLNIPVNKDGLISRMDSLHVVQFHQNIQAELAHDLLKGKKAEVSDCRGRGFTSRMLTDGKYDTYWATHDSVKTAEVVFQFRRPLAVNRLLLQEYIPLGQRVKSFSVFFRVGDVWSPLPIPEETTTIGYKRLLRFATVHTKGLKIRFNDARGALCLNRIGAFYANTPLSNKEEVSRMEVPASYPYILVGEDSAKAKAINDRNAATTYFTTKDTLKIDLESVRKVSGLTYLPDQGKENHGLISNYALYQTDSLFTDKKLLIGGEFSNIRNNPVMQWLGFPEVKTRYLLFVVTRMIHKDEKKGFAELGIH